LAAGARVYAIKHILEKLGANDRTQAVTIAAQRGIIQI
jgi:DNA-binding NarL/FixJ family response regulator